MSGEDCCGRSLCCVPVSECAVESDSDEATVGGCQCDGSGRLGVTMTVLVCHERRFAVLGREFELSNDQVAGDGDS